MGKGKKRNKERNEQRNEQSLKKRAENSAYDGYTVVLQNLKFENYYKNQNILNDAQLDNLFEIVKVPLPISFRITETSIGALDLLNFMKNVMFKKLLSVQEENPEFRSMALPTPLPWFPNELAWTFEIPRSILKKSPIFKQFQDFLVSETDIGNISRQEAVSMIPPLLLDVKTGHIVLDMCAAPGSKTAQLLEAVMGKTREFPKGLVIANDSDARRAHMLVHQAKRLQTPGLMVTNHDAQEFPKIILQRNDKKMECLLFDRILCDVPCSGDGTMRKNRNIFKTWNSSNGNGLHPLQVRILIRGARLLKVGGLLVYSTCSFNPLENEAVVATLLKEAKGAFELVDVSDKLQGLERKPGLSTWKVPKGDEMHTEFKQDLGVSETMFPPADIQLYNMERCLRVYPFQQNYGGFFIAVLRKVKEFGNLKARVVKRVLQDVVGPIVGPIIGPMGKENTSKLDLPQDENPPTKKTKLGLEGWKGSVEEPFLFVEPNNTVISELMKVYGISSNFPKQLFVVRTENNDFRNIYAVTEAAKSVLTSINASALNIVNTGVKIFTRTSAAKTEKKNFRACNEGIPTILKYCNPETFFEFGFDDVLLLTTVEYPKFEEFSAEGKERLEKLDYGNYLMRFDASLAQGYSGSISCPIVGPFLRSHASCSLLLDKAEKKSLQCRLLGL